MEFILSSALALALLAVSSPVAVSQDVATSPDQLYWRMKLPNTPIPRPIQAFLPETQSLTQGGENFFMASGGVLQSRSFYYMHAATKENVEAGKIADIFFFEHQLKPGSKLRIQFLTATRKAKFLSAQISNTIKMSSKYLPKLLTRLSINLNTTAANLMTQTITDCETPSVSGETQVCAVSLKQLVDFSIKSLETNKIEVKATEVEKEDNSVQEYIVQDGVERVFGNRTVACHTKDFAYPVYICHAASTRLVYKLPLAGVDGRKVNAVVACHTNTVQWNPNNLAFQMLKVKPGSVVICHFLPEDHMIWGTSD